MRRRAPRQSMEKVQAGVVAPVNIFNDEKDRRVLRKIKEKLRQHCEETTFFLFRFEWWEAISLLRNQFREQRKDITG